MCLKKKIIIKIGQRALFLTRSFILVVFVLSGSVVMAEKADYEKLRKQMVEEQIYARGVRDENVLEAMARVKRHVFVPQNVRAFAYEDHPLPIGYGQTISQPFVVAYMTELLNLQGSEKVLEIGTGSGYQAAILGETAKEVYTIEIVEGLAVSAKALLKKLGYKNIHVKYGDGYAGWPEVAPFDAIIVTAAPKEIPPKLVEQLKVGGRMVVPVGSFFQSLYVVTKTEDGIVKKDVLPVRFVPMVHGEN